MKTVIFIAVILASFQTFAGNPYVGIGYQVGSYEEYDYSKSTPTAAQFYAGYSFNKWLAFEAHIMRGLEHDYLDRYHYPVTVEVEEAVSLFAKISIPLADSVNFYGLLGATRGKLRFSIPNTQFTGTSTDSGFSYGLGFEATAGNNIGFAAEYTRLISESDYVYTAITAKIFKRF